MEQIYNKDNIYVIDLGEINTAPEVIFELSSILDKEEVKNKRICLKLGNIDLNQAQILSIKSLISGIDSVLSSIDTASTETEKVALSLGIIVSNVSAENSTEVAPANPYKTAEEYKEEIQSNQEEIKEENNNNEIIEEQVPEEEEKTDTAVEQSQEDVIIEETNIRKEEEKKSSEMEDELEVIFGSDPVKTSIFEMEVPQEIYKEDSEEKTQINIAEQEYTKEDMELEAFPTKYIKQTIRSGQVVNYEGNVVIIGDCHPGSEVTAFGDITVWGILSGIAHAGAGGNEKARVRALKMNAIQIRIANCYSRRPDSLNTVYIEKTNSFVPEEARILNSEIVVFKIND